MSCGWSDRDPDSLQSTIEINFGALAIAMVMSKLFPEVGESSLFIDRAKLKRFEKTFSLCKFAKRLLAADHS